MKMRNPILPLRQKDYKQIFCDSLASRLFQLPKVAKSVNPLGNSPKTFQKNSVKDSTTKYLEMFFSNLLGTDHELKNRYMHVDYVDEDNSQSATSEIPKCQNDTLGCSLEELAVLNLIKANPTVKQQELVDTTGKSLRSIKRIMKSLQDKNYIRRENGKRYGKWEILI